MPGGSFLHALQVHKTFTISDTQDVSWGQQSKKIVTRVTLTALRVIEFPGIPVACLLPHKTPQIW